MGQASVVPRVCLLPLPQPSCLPMCPHRLGLTDVPAGAATQTNEPPTGVPGCFLSVCKVWGSSGPRLPPHPGPLTLEMGVTQGGREEPLAWVPFP